MDLAQLDLSLGMPGPSEARWHELAVGIAAAGSAMLLLAHWHRCRRAQPDAGTTPSPPSVTDRPPPKPANDRPPLPRWHCEICKLHCRSASNFREHLKGKTHAHNAALLSGAAVAAVTEKRLMNAPMSESVTNRTVAYGSEQVVRHCAICDAWVPSHDTQHEQTRAHKAAARESAAGTRSRQFVSGIHVDEEAGSAIGVITCDLEQEANAGAICRVLANFATAGARLVHVTTGTRESTHQLLISGRVRRVARNCETKLERTLLTLGEFVAAIGTWERPIVAVETATGAVSICDFRFPPECDLLVGGESLGVHVDILTALRPGIDHIVFIPMAGFYQSMNVSAATSVALFEFRRQHPGLKRASGGDT